MTKTNSVPTVEVFARLWLHECSRVFADRLNNQEDRDYYKELAMELLG
jgi:hypothetical protein